MSDCLFCKIIAGDIPSYYYGKHPHQEVNMHIDASQYRLLEPVCKRVWRVDDPEALPDIMDKARTYVESMKDKVVCPLTEEQRARLDKAFVEVCKDAGLTEETANWLIKTYDEA